eukprot:GILJ01005255.1.p1 GENE.GILJ01005255.1~~GILJ01005255.1.p1  ORF type:complete len:499 (-),score=67.65 GILJ01005255.1:164-1516(-)
MADCVYFDDLKYFYANIIDYARVVMCILAGWTISTEWHLTSAFLVIGSILLDWVDGPVARAYGQCCIFGSGIDWLADILGQLVTIVWWIRYDTTVLPWLLVATSIEMGTAIFDFATTATGKYPVLQKNQTGFYLILEWSMPEGSYTHFGTFLWLAYPVYSVLRILEHIYGPDSPFAFVFLLNNYLLYVPSVMYIWCEAAYGAHIISSWTEPSRKVKPGQADIIYDDSPRGLTHYGSVSEKERSQLSELFDSTVRHYQADWQAKINKSDIFWCNLWQRSGDQKSVVEGTEVIRAWVEAMTSKYFNLDDCELDGFGFITNPIGSKTQPWHLDYAASYSTIFIPITETSPANAVQYVKGYDRLNSAQLAAVLADPDNIDINLLQKTNGSFCLRQLVCDPFSIVKMDFGTIHRGVSNTGTYHRNMFFISVRKKNMPLLPPEKAFETIEEYSKSS